MKTAETPITPPGPADEPETGNGLPSQESLEIKAGREAVRLALSGKGLGKEEVATEELKKAEHIALRRMQKILTYLEGRMNVEDAEKDPDDLAEEIFSDLERNEIKPTTQQKAILRVSIKKYVQKCKVLKPIREELEKDKEESQLEGKSSLLRKIGLDWINPEQVEVNLDDPLFIGILFSNKEDANRARENCISRDPYGWVGSFRCEEIPELESCLYSINTSKHPTKEEIKSTKDHEIQHLITQNFYPIEGHSFDGSDYLRTMNQEDQASMFDEALAYLKGGEYGESLKQLLGAEREENLGTIPIRDRIVILVKRELLKKLYEIAQRKNIKAKELYEVLKTSNKLDDLLNLGLENLCSIQEQESWLNSWKKFLPPPVWEEVLADQGTTSRKLMLCSFLYQRLRGFTKRLATTTDEKEWTPYNEEAERKLKEALTRDLLTRFPGQEMKVDDEINTSRFFYDANNIIHRCERWEDTLEHNRLN